MLVQLTQVVSFQALETKNWLL